jgi:cell division protein FtsI (penicillin-binding protein 3)
VDVKKDILWRVYLSFIALVVLGFMVLGKVVHLQFVEGNKWRNLGDSLHQSIEKRPAERGTIYSEDIEMLSSSIPFFDVHIDFRADGLRAKNGKLFTTNVDSLSYYLSKLFNDRTKNEYKQILQKGYKQKLPYFELKSHITYQQYYKLRSFPLVKLGQYKSGFIVDVKDERLNPFGLLANRTIGLSRDPKLNVGLEKYYDSTLSGQSGSRLVQYIAGGTRMPINGSEIEPINGKDIVTTLNVQIQDIAQNALLKMMQQNEALSGTAIVMEVATGKIKAIANLGRQKDGSYYEDNNYALVPTEPGSTIKVVTLMAALEDKIVNINSTVEINGGIWYFGDRKIVDAERSPKDVLTYKEALEHSSNVAMAKLAALNYNKQPAQYIKHFTTLRLNKKTGIDLNDPYNSLIKDAKSKSWSNQTLASMGFGYELRISPLQTLMVYNAIANKGKMMKPYLVTDIKQGEAIVKHIDPTVLNNTICSASTLSQLKECLEAVCISGTAKRAFDSINYTVAGKTGTAKVNDGTYQYTDNVYQSSFVGYFPANNPKYSCIVVIKNKPYAVFYHGGKIAAPVFKEISDQLVTLTKGNYSNRNINLSIDSFRTKYRTTSSDADFIVQKMNLKNKIIGTDVWSNLQQGFNGFNSYAEKIALKTMPNVVGMGLKDALFCLENKGVRVSTTGKGKVVSQNIAAGTNIEKNMSVTIVLN